MKFEPESSRMRGSTQLTFFQLTGLSGSLGPNETILFEATRLNREYDGFPYLS